MSNRFTDKGRQLFAGSADFGADTLCFMPVKLNGSLVDTCIKQITAITTATPPVVTTSASHGFTSGEIVCQKYCAGMLNANGTFKITVLSGTTYSLQTLDGQNVVGTGTFTGTAGVINLTMSTFFDAYDGAVCSGAPALASATALSGKGNVNGTLTAGNITGITLNDTVDALLLVKRVTNAADSPVMHFADGRTKVVVVAAASGSATSIAVEPLEGPVPSGTVIQMTNGITVTTTAGGAIGDRTLTVSALSGAIAAGHHGDAQTTSSGLPITATSGTFNHDISAGIGTI